MHLNYSLLRVLTKGSTLVYSDQASRPNVPINVLLGLEALKGGFGWSDEEMYHAFLFDVQVRYELGIRNLGESDFELRTVYNFRQRLSQHMRQTGENLIDVAFGQVTDEQAAAFRLKTGRLRMDSTQIASNIRRMSCLQLLVEVIQRVQRMLSETDRTGYADVLAPYLKGSSGQYVYHLRDEDLSPHFQRLGEVMYQLVGELAANYQSHATYQVLERVFHEQFVLNETPRLSLVEDDRGPDPDGDQPTTGEEPPATLSCPAPPGPELSEGGEASSPAVTATSHAAAPLVQARPSTDISPQRLRSPDNPEATYRRKGSQEYAGYVVNLTETCDPDNPFQLIVKIQTAANTTQDTTLLAEVLPELKVRTGVHTLHNDGGYTGPSVDPTLQRLGVVQIPSALPGTESDARFTRLADCAIALDACGQPLKLTCPHGYVANVSLGQKAGRYVAHWCDAPCPDCHFNRNHSDRREANPSLCARYSQTELNCALRRQRCRAYHLGKKSLRAAVEATIGALKCPFNDDQAPVRGKLRLGQMMIGSAFMVNIRRIQRYLLDQLRPNPPAPADGPKPAPAPKSGGLPGYPLLCTIWSRFQLWFRPMPLVRAPVVFGF